MKMGTKTHLCEGYYQVSGQAFGRIVNLYVHQEGKWVKIGTICSNCADHWIDGKVYKAPRPKSKRTA
jgi:hypothetical protein